ncbi:MAG: hypothetical protein KDC98_24290, partial [Planctomycetes bacterium]|nr:hypothetical protein [Planctomycetota bacterium]
PPAAIALDPFGAPECSLYLDPTAPHWRGVGGTDELTAAIPSRPALLGQRFTAQAAAWTPGANALGLVTSNAMALTIGSL